MKIFSLLSGVLLSVAAHAQVTTEWVNYPGGVSIATDAMDNVYTVNWVYNPGGDIILSKRNSSGTVLWETAYDNTDSTKHEVATWVETDSTGNAIVTGTVRSGYSNPVNANSLVMKFDPSGQLLWRAVYENYFDGSYTKKALVDAQDNIYVLGMGSGPAGLVATVKKFAPDGTALWSYFDSAGIGAPVNFKLTPDNHILIAGRAIYGSVNGYAKIDLNGNNIWNRAGVYSLTVGDAAGDSTGNSYFVDGEYVTAGGSIVTKTSPTGALLWQQTNVMSAQRVEVGNDDQPVISGFPNSGTAGAAFMKYASNGDKLWENLDADGPSLGLLLHAQMKMDADNSAYLAAGTLFEMAVCKINSDGSSAWTATAAGSYAYGFDFGQDNSVYVVGGQTAKFSQGTISVDNADLSLVMTDSPDPVRRSTNLVYTMTVTNNGASAATNVVMSDTLPSNIVFVRATSTQGSCSGTTLVSCTIGTLNVGANATVNITVRPRFAGTLNNSANVVASEYDPNTANNSASATTTVTRR